MLVFVVLTEHFKVHTNLATAIDVVVVVALRVLVDWKGIVTPTAAAITPGLLERIDERAVEPGEDEDQR